MAQRYKSYDLGNLRSLVTSRFPSIVPAHTAEGHRYQREDTSRFAWSVTTKLGFVNKGYLHKWYAKRAVEHVKDNVPRLCEGDLSVLDEAVRAGEQSRDASASIGTTAHGAIDQFLSQWIQQGARPEISAAAFLAEGSRGEEIAACRSFDRFVGEVEIIPVASETRVWYESGKDCFAGTVDVMLILRRPKKGRDGALGCKARASIGGHDYERQSSGLLWCVECGREAEERLVLGDWKTSNHIQGKDDYSQQDTAYAVAVEKAAGIKFDELWVVRFDKTKAEFEICEVTDRKAAWKEFLTISRAFDEKQKREGRSLLEPIETKEVIKI